ncbi:nucleotidyltransferase family protein [Stakelama tenebrarum]|uniref:Nucleotidyltransferase family protein n=1 Tax=Stakelama tenebrarum TaxID=2711215 RepID=A0A6G6Y985_9SPHN|nr:nucleotidyltransferase family protein [Sphingosinithalassobacter tenebrarum]QIG81502.1 nucleotidyltransferase family protein [Sphingosinithalassobacter tenebrarum]
MRAEDVVLMLLAAGRSRRFGDTDKLEQHFLHQPLAFHVVTALEAVPFQARVAVVSGTSLDFAARGYRVVHNDTPESGQSHSLALCTRAARELGARAVLVALADMPRVTAAHVWRLLDEADGPDAVVASSDGHAPCPPALFGASHFDALESQQGDQGARALVRAGHHVIASPAELVDIDTPGDLAALREKYGVD